MAKLTEKQAEVIRRMLAGEPLQYHDGFRSNGYYTFGKAPNWQNLKGYAGSINGLRDRKIIKYQKAVGLWGQDLVFVDEAQARDMLTAYDGGRAAIAATAVAAQPVSVATDAAPAFTPIEAQGWHHLIDPRVMIELPADSPFIEQLTDRRIDAWFAEPSSHTQYVVWKFDENEYQIGIRYDEPTDEKLTAFKAWVLAQHSAPAPDAAQTAAAVTVASIQAALDAIEWTDNDSGRVIVAKVEQLSDGIGSEWFFKDTGLWLDFEVLGKTLDEAMRHVKAMIDKDDRKVDPRAAQIAALTRDLEAARADAAALRAQVLGLINHGKAARFMLTQAVSIGLDLASAPNQRELLDYIYSAVDEMPPEDFELPAVYAAPDNGQRVSAEAEMIAALRQRDNGNRTPADNVLAMFADDDEGTIA